MKSILLAATVGLASLSVSNAAISISGTALSGIGAANAPAGSLILFVVDTNGDGFFGNAALSGDLTAANNPGLTPAQAGLTLNSTFGGDLVVGRTAVSSAGSLVGTLTDFDNLAGTFQGKNFALIWLPGLTTSSTTLAGGQIFGITSGSDWTLPAANAGQTYSYAAASADETTFFRPVVTAGVTANDRFTTSGGATFTIIPEPSVALLGALGVLGLIRRRR